ncbi:MAG: hypothetical protein P4L60_05700 [Clostridium sp.]|nr:hypothetical protein [Clostridium sp.]
MNKMKTKPAIINFSDIEIKENEFLYRLSQTVTDKFYEIKEAFTEDEINHFEQLNNCSFNELIVSVIHIIFSEKLSLLKKEDLKKKLMRNNIKPDRLKLYKKIIDKITEAKARGFKPNISDICKANNKDSIYDLRKAFDEWKRGNKPLFNSLMNEYKLKWEKKT